MWSFNDTEEKSVYPFVKTTSEHADNETERTLAVSRAWPRGKPAPGLMFTPAGWGRSGSQSRQGRAAGVFPVPPVGSQIIFPSLPDYELLSKKNRVSLIARI